MKQFICRSCSGQFHALASAYLSVVCGVILAVFSFIIASSESSLSLFALCILAIIDIATSTLVIIYWQGNYKVTERKPQQSIQEHRYTTLIGMMMIMMGLLLFGNSLKTLIYKQRPAFDAESSFNFNTSLFGTVTSLVLALYKYFVSVSLDSPLIKAG